MVKDKRTGFTLIELIIVIFVILLFAGMSLAYYGGFNEDKKLFDEVKKVEATLYLARSKSSAADADPALCTDFRGYRLYITNAQTYSLQRNCGGTYGLIQQETLPSTIRITSTTPQQILFKPLNTGTDLVAITSIVIKSTIANRCVNIQVTPLGVVSEGSKYSC